MTENELIQMADDYCDVAAKKKEAEGYMKILKSNIVDELSKVDDVKFDFKNGLTAAKQVRKGTVDMKALQIKYNISDSDLDLLRKAATESWVLKVK